MVLNVTSPFASGIAIGSTFSPGSSGTPVGTVIREIGVRAGVGHALVAVGGLARSPGRVRVRRDLDVHLRGQVDVDRPDVLRLVQELVELIHLVKING
jgi:hypothetical protein